VKALIVFESMFGNTEELARAVARGLVADRVEVSLIGVSAAADLDLAPIDLLVVAAPTHAFSLSRPQTRADAVTRGAEPGRAGVGVREWLTSLDGGPGRKPPVAVFDTRAGKVRHLPGSAGRRAAASLKRKGFTLLAGPVSFYVDDVRGPLAQGELERAEQWGQELAILMGSDSSAPQST
jgi:hypothetical protein